MTRCTSPVVLRVSMLCGVALVAACGGGFDGSARVVSVSDEELCVDSVHSPGHIRCAERSDVDEQVTTAEGDCIRGHFAGESARLLEVHEVADCDLVLAEAAEEGE